MGPVDAMQTPLQVFSLTVTFIHLATAWLPQPQAIHPPRTSSLVPRTTGPALHFAMTFDIFLPFVGVPCLCLNSRVYIHPCQPQR